MNAEGIHGDGVDAPLTRTIIIVEEVCQRCLWGLDLITSYTRHSHIAITLTKSHIT